MCCTHKYMYLFHAVFQLNLAWKTRLRFLLAFTTLTLSSPPSHSFTCVYFKLFPFVALTTFLSNWSLPLSLPCSQACDSIYPTIFVHIFTLAYFQLTFPSVPGFPEYRYTRVLYVRLYVCTFFPTIICLLLSHSHALPLARSTYLQR